MKTAVMQLHLVEDKPHHKYMSVTYFDDEFLYTRRGFQFFRVEQDFCVAEYHDTLKDQHDQVLALVPVKVSLNEAYRLYEKSLQTTD